MMDDRPEIPDATIANWQRIVDLIARVAEVPAGLIMRTTAPRHAVVVSSVSEGNPYEPGQGFRLHAKLYCQGVFDRDGELVVEDAEAEPRWCDNEDLAFGMRFYIGFPLKWPDGTIFGTICVLDRARNERALLFREGLREFARVIEADLGLLTEIALRRHLESELQETLDELEQRVDARTRDLEEANTALRVLLSNVEQSRQDYDRQVRHQIKGLVMPHLLRLRSRLSGDAAGLAYLHLLEESLKSISANGADGLAEAFAALTPAELEIAQMVMAGQSTKDIARTLGRETSTIDFHRNNIRRKLGLQGSRQNLRTLLLSLR